MITAIEAKRIATQLAERTDVRTLLTEIEVAIQDTLTQPGNTNYGTNAAVYYFSETANRVQRQVAARQLRAHGFQVTEKWDSLMISWAHAEEDTPLQGNRALGGVLK